MLKFSKKKNKQEKITDISEAVINIQHGNFSLREDFILQHKNFVLKCVSDYKNNPSILEDSDEYSIALIAFNEAINTFNMLRGMAFLNYASIVIRNRLNDHARKMKNESKVVSLDQLAFDKTGRRTNFDIAYEDRSFHGLEVRDEINLLEKELGKYKIKLKDLLKLSPKEEPTRKKLISLANILYKEKDLLEKLRRTKLIPISEILELTTISRRTIERNRKYIIALVVVLDSKLETIKGYIIDMERGEAGED